MTRPNIWARMLAGGLFTNDSICMFLSPLGKPGSPTRQQSDDVFEYLVSPAAYKAQFEPEYCIRRTPGSIFGSIYRSIQKASVVVADLSSGNFNVGYELCIAFDLRKPTVLLVEEEDEVPFDIGDMNAIPYPYDGDCRKFKNAVSDLTEQLKQLKKGPPFSMDNPLLAARRFVKNDPGDGGPPPLSTPLVKPRPIEQSLPQTAPPPLGPPKPKPIMASCAGDIPSGVIAALAGIDRVVPKGFLDQIDAPPISSLLEPHRYIKDPKKFGNFGA